MTQPAALLRSKRYSFRSKGPFSRLLVYLRLVSNRKTLPEGADVPSRTAGALDQSFLVDPDVVCDHLVDLVDHLRSLLPGSCEWLEQGALEIVGEHPVDAGGVADVWVAKMGYRKVAIKNYRCYSSSNYLPTYVKFYKEALACSRLEDQYIVPFIGVYSTPKHPLALVFEFMDHSNLREYLRNDKDVRRRELLLEIARGVEYMHKLNVVHGNLKITNILVDARGRAHVAGLGVAFLSAMSEVDIDRFFRGAAPELIDPQRFGLTGGGATKASDMYAFGVLAWEIFAGRAPFSGESEVAGVHSMLSGRRPPRPDHPELSDRAWGMIKGCWENVPSQRRTITEVIAALTAELNHQ